MSGSSIPIKTTKLTPEVFAPYGNVIAAPLPSSATTIPSSPPPNAVFANQNTALKYANISPLMSVYHLSPSKNLGQPTMSLFSCFPRNLRSHDGQEILDLQILERHPFTTQTFIPIQTHTPSTARAIIIVAPTLPSSTPESTLTPYFLQSKPGGPPDLENVKAFVAEPGMGVTYAAGTWHAPMIVVGDGRIDFGVTQYANGHKEDDCQEVDTVKGLEVIIDVGVLDVVGTPKL